MYQVSEGYAEFQENVRYGIKTMEALSKLYPGLSQAPVTKSATCLPFFCQVKYESKILWKSLLIEFWRREGKDVTFHSQSHHLGKCKTGFLKPSLPLHYKCFFSVIQLLICLASLHLHIHPPCQILIMFVPFTIPKCAKLWIACLRLCSKVKWRVWLGLSSHGDILDNSFFSQTHRLNRTHFFLLFLTMLLPFPDSRTICVIL